MSYYDTYFEEFNACITSVKHDDLRAASKMILDTSKRGGKIILVGNGGSASISSHVTVDLLKVAKIRAVNFNESNLITCYANDYGYQNWVSEALKSYANQGDLLILISSSGESPNIINAAAAAQQIGLRLITFSGFSEENRLRKLGDINFWIDSKKYNYVELTHETWLLSIVDSLIENVT